MKKFIGTTTMLLMLAAVTTTPAQAVPYVGMTGDPSSGNNQVVVGADNLTGVFGVEATFNSDSILSTKLTTCKQDRHLDRACVTSEYGGIDSSLTATATLPLTEKFAGVAKLGVGNMSQSYLMSAGASYAFATHLRLTAAVTSYQLQGDRVYRQTIGAQFTF